MPPAPPPQVYEDLDFTLLEMNPFTLDAAGKPFPLDMRGELDDTAAFRRSVCVCEGGSLAGETHLFGFRGRGVGVGGGGGGRLF